MIHAISKHATLTNDKTSLIQVKVTQVKKGPSKSAIIKKERKREKEKRHFCPREREREKEKSKRLYGHLRLQFPQ